MGSTREARHDGRNADTIVTTRPTTSDRMIVRGAMTGTVDGRSRPTAFRAAISRNASPIPPSSPTSEPTAPVMNASMSTDLRICAAAGAEGAQHGELPGPLRDHDPEDVVDEERTGHERDAGEAAQHDVELADPLLEVVLRLLGGRVAGHRLDAGRQHRPDVARPAAPGETPVVGVRLELVGGALLAERLRGRRRVHQHEAGAELVVAPREGGDARRPAAPSVRARTCTSIVSPTAMSPFSAEPLVDHRLRRARSAACPPTRS